MKTSKTDAQLREWMHERGLIAPDKPLSESDAALQAAKHREQYLRLGHATHSAIEFVLRDGGVGIDMSKIRPGQMVVIDEMAPVMDAGTLDYVRAVNYGVSGRGESHAAGALGRSSAVPKA